MKTSQTRRSLLRLGLCLAVLAMLAACTSPPPFFKSSKWPPERDWGRGGFAYDVKVVGNYAYVAHGLAGLQVTDVSDPANCMRVGGYDTGRYVPDVYARDVAVSGNYAYLVSEEAGLQVIDVRTAKAVRVGGYVPLKGDR